MSFASQSMKYNIRVCARQYTSRRPLLWRLYSTIRYTGLLVIVMPPCVTAEQLHGTSGVNFEIQVRNCMVCTFHKRPGSKCPSPSLIQSHTHLLHLSLHHAILFLLHSYHPCRQGWSLSPVVCLRALPCLSAPPRPRWVKGATAHNEFNYSSACFYGGGALGTLPSTSLYWSEASKGRKDGVRGGRTQMDRWEGINLVEEENNCVLLKW